MSSQVPHARLVGTWRFWIAPASTAEPAIDTTSLTAWTEFGRTDGDQTFAFTGGLTPLRDNQSTVPLKHIRPDGGLDISGTLISMTLENWAVSLSRAVSAVVTATSGAFNVKRLPLGRTYAPTQYALLARGGAIEPTNSMSAYMVGPAQIWIPKGVFEGTPSPAFGRAGNPGLAFMFHAEWDATQAAGYEVGVIAMATSPI